MEVVRRDPCDYMPVRAPSNEELVRRIADGPNVWIAAGDGDIERVRFLLDNGDMTPTSADAARYTPIHAAASYARHDMMCVCADQPVSVGARKGRRKRRQCA